MSTLKVNNIQNKSGGNTSTADEIYSGRAKAWVNFDGTTGTLNQPDVTIRASFNVSSVTDNGTGYYTVTFTNAMTDANYCCQVSGGNDDGGGQGGWNSVLDLATTLTTSVRLAYYSSTSGAAQDQEQCFLTVFS